MKGMWVWIKALKDEKFEWKDEKYVWVGIKGWKVYGLGLKDERPVDLD